MVGQVTLKDRCRRGWPFLGGLEGEWGLDRRITFVLPRGAVELPLLEANRTALHFGRAFFLGQRKTKVRPIQKGKVIFRIGVFMNRTPTEQGRTGRHMGRQRSLGAGQ